MKSFFLITLIVSGSLFVTAQKSRVIELRSANELIGKVIEGEQVQELVGNVHFIQPSEAGKTIRVWCDRGIRYMNQNKVELFGNVKIIRDSTILTSKEGTYYANDRRAVVTKGVKLQRGNTTLTAKFGEYYSDDKKAFFQGDVIVNDTASQINSDKLTFYENEGQYIAVGNVVINNFRDALMVFSDSVINYEKQHYTLAPKNPILMQIDTSSSGTIDTLLVKSITMEVFQDTVAQRFIARDSVLMVHPDISTRCRLATYYLRKGQIVLKGEPIIWYEKNQLSGDSVIVYLEQRRLNKVHIIGRAMVVSQADSLYDKRFNQLTGRELTMHFDTTGLKQIDVQRNATSLYYLFDDEGANGASKSSGDRIIIEFAGNKVDKIRVLGGVQGTFYPELMITNRENEYNLDGFKWYERRPIRRNLQIMLDKYE
jgi:lipopolysaccharide export system protein LptA